MLGRFSGGCCWRSFWRVARRFVLEGRELDWRERSGKIWVSKVARIAAGADVERTSAERDTFLRW